MCLYRPKLFIKKTNRMGHIGHTGQYGSYWAYRSVWVILGIPVRMGLPVVWGLPVGLLWEVGIPNTHSRNAWLLSCSDIGIMSELPVRTATVNYFLIKTNGWEVGMT